MRLDIFSEIRKRKKCFIYLPLSYFIGNKLLMVKYMMKLGKLWQEANFRYYNILWSLYNENNKKRR